jgi:hypothetical protein
MRSGGACWRNAARIFLSPEARAQEVQKRFFSARSSFSPFCDGSFSFCRAA